MDFNTSSIYQRLGYPFSLLLKERAEVFIEAVFTSFVKRVQEDLLLGECDIFEQVIDEVLEEQVANFQVLTTHIDADDEHLIFSIDIKDENEKLEPVVVLDMTEFTWSISWDE